MQRITETLEQIKERMEQALAAEGMPAELPVDEDLASIDGFASLADETARTEITTENEEASGPETMDPVEGAGLTYADTLIVDEVRARGYAATLAEAGDPDPETLERLADAGLAHLRASGKETVLAMAGATTGDVEKAANRARADELGEDFEETVRTAEEIAIKVAGRLRRLGGACVEGDLYAGMAAFPREAVTAVLENLRANDALKRARSPKTGLVLFAAAGAGREQLKAAAARHARIEALSSRNAARKDKDAFAAEISASIGEYDPRPDALEYLRGRAALMGETAAHEVLTERLAGFREEAAALKFGAKLELLKALPFKSTLDEAMGEDPEVAEWVRSYRGSGSKSSDLKAAKRREENRRAIERAERNPRRRASSRRIGETARRIEAHKARVRGAFAEARETRTPEEVALATAEAVLRNGFSPEENRVLALIESNGGLLLEASPELEPLGEAVASLGKAGFVKRARRRSDGAVFLKATPPREEVLLGAINDPENGIPLPEGPGLPERAPSVA